MADALNRTTKEYRQSVNTPDYPTASWIINPSLSAVTGFPSRYWTITGDVVSLMNQAARDAVDAGLLVAARDSAVSQLQQTEDVLRATLLIILDEFNAHAAKVNALLTAIDNASSLANLKTAVLAIADLPTRTESDLRTAIRNRLGT